MGCTQNQFVALSVNGTNKSTMGSVLGSISSAGRSIVSMGTSFMMMINFMIAASSFYAMC